MLLTYEEYRELGGGLDNTAFNIYAFEAETRIMAETHGRINTSEAVKRSIVRIAELLSQSDVFEKRVTSWSNDGVSESIKEVSAEEYETKIKGIINSYLANEVDSSNVPLLYLGGVKYD